MIMEILTKKMKMWVGLFKIMGGNILCGNYLGRNFREGIYQGEV